VTTRLSVVGGIKEKMAHSWRILRASVEQEILFPSYEAYMEYLDKLSQRKEPYEVVKSQTYSNGNTKVIMRKRYNNNKFLNRDSI